MNITELPYKTPLKVSENSLVLYDPMKAFYIWDRSTLEEICSHDFSGEFLNVENFGNGFVFNLPKKNDGYIYEKDSNELSKIRTNYSLYMKLKEDRCIGISKKDFKYALLDSKYESVRSFERLEDIYTMTCKQGFVDYTTHVGANNYLRLRDPLTNQTIYQCEIQNQGSDHEYRNPYFLLRVRSEEKWLIYCFDLEKRNLIWKIDFKGLPRCIIDQNTDTVLFSSNYKYLEIRLDRFEIVNEFILERNENSMRPEVMRFLSKNGIFYYCSQRENKIGMINRQTGIIEWEYDYLPEQCKSLNIYFWEEVLNGDCLINIQDNKFPRLILLKEKYDSNITLNK